MFLEVQGDPYSARTIGVDVSSNIAASPMTGKPRTQVTPTATLLIPDANSSTPRPTYHTSRSALDVVDAKVDTMLYYEGRFLGYTCVASTGKLKVSFLVDDNQFPMKTIK